MKLKLFCSVSCYISTAVFFFRQSIWGGTRGHGSGSLLHRRKKSVMNFLHSSTPRCESAIQQPLRCPLPSDQETVRPRVKACEIRC